MKDKPIKVMIVDDHMMVRKGLAQIVASFKDMQLVGEADNAESAIKLFESKQPDVTLMDMVLPDIHGAETIRRIRQKRKDAVFIALTSFGEEALIKEALQSGARGFLYKDVHIKDLAAAIRQVHKGGLALHPKASNLMMRIVENSATVTEPVAPELTKRERDVLQYVVQGLTNKQIAAQLNIKLSTVKLYTSNILAKLKAKSRTEAAAEALRLGLVKQ